ncbi:MAG: Mn2+/Fe2+ NRAMP family transporter [Bermanella sp.]
MDYLIKTKEKVNMKGKSSSFFSVLGPGILYAAAAVGVSHLVQSTRAGADYGLGLTFIIILACLVKYPALRFGGEFAAATGKSLITSYRSAGRCVFGIYALTAMFSMVFVVGAIALFTLGLVQAAFGFSVDPVLGVSILLFFCALFLFSGHYSLLEKFTKYVVACFSLLIFLTVILVARTMDWSLSLFTMPSIDSTVILYVVALIGFMPSPTDGSVMQSLWTCARAEDTGKLPTPKEARLDFNVGYVISTLLALCFLVLGTGLMNNTGVEIEVSNSGFSRQLMELFTQTIGPWSFPLIATIAIFVMFSTLLAVVDGVTRILVGILEVGYGRAEIKKSSKRFYNTSIVIICVAAIIILATMLESFAKFIDITAVIVFVISPIIAYLNHHAMWSDQVPIDMQPSLLMKIWSICGIFILTSFMLIYFYYRLFA